MFNESPFSFVDNDPEMETPSVYLILGIPDSGRREIILDLIKDGFGDHKTVLYFRPEDALTDDFDAPLADLEKVSVVPWRLEAGKITHGPIESAPEGIFFLAPGRSDPAAMAEALKLWLDHNQCRLARIITVVHCAFLEAHPEAKAWFDACIHFSDVVLLNRRESVSNKWVKDFENSFRKEHFPARFIMVKKGRVPNPAEVTDPEARRLSLYFDELVPLEEDEMEDESVPEDTRPDKYIETLVSGQRSHPIPDIAKFLD